MRKALQPGAGDATRDLVIAAYRDFAIVCYQRSGSHLLATALNSHPEVSCQEELLQAIKTPHKAYAPKPVAAHGVSGAIVMYNQWKLAGQLGISPKKFIHLLRDPVMTAISIARNEADSEIRGASHRPHALRGSTRMHVTDFDRTAVPEVAETIAKQQESFSALLAGFPVLDVRYEDLTSDKDIDVLPREASVRILEFLGVARCDITLAAVTKKTS